MSGLKKIVSTTLAALALALPVTGCKVIDSPVAVTEYSHPAADLKSQETNVYPGNYPKKESYDEIRLLRRQSLDLEGFVAAGFGTDFVDRRDFITDKGLNNQYFFVLNKKNSFNDGDNLSGGFLSDFSIEHGKTFETDFFVNYSVPVDFPKRLAGGYSDESFGDRIFLGYEHWNYNLINRPDQDVMTFRWFHNSRVDLDFKYYAPLDTPVSSGLLSFTVSKKLPLKEIGEFGLYLTPSANVCYDYNWQGLNGFPEFTPGITISAERRGLIISGSFKHQCPMLKEIKDRDYASVEVGFKF